MCQALLGQIQNEPIFATTREDNVGMQTILKKIYLPRKEKCIKTGLKRNFFNYLYEIVTYKIT